MNPAFEYNNQENKVNISRNPSSVTEFKYTFYSYLVEEIKNKVPNLYNFSDIELYWLSSTPVTYKVVKKSIDEIAENRGLGENYLNEAEFSSDFLHWKEARDSNIREIIDTNMVYKTNPTMMNKIASDGSFIILKKGQEIEDFLLPFTGNENDNIIYGTHDNNELTGNGGDDTIYGWGQTQNKHGDEDKGDTIKGGSGSDTIYGGEGNDHLYADQDFLFVSPTTLIGGKGDDHLYGGRRFDYYEVSRFEGEQHDVIDDLGGNGSDDGGKGLKSKVIM